jgi:hypothetical protein
MKIQNSLGIGPIEDRQQISALRKAIENVELPWSCSLEIEQEAKAAAIDVVINGSVPRSFIKKLVPEVFKTQRDAKHAMAMLSAIGSSAVTRETWRSVGVLQYEWQYLEFLCSYPEHEKRQRKIFPTTKDDMPATRYGCRCLGFAVFEDA